MIKNLIRQICPPIILNFFNSITTKKELISKNDSHKTIIKPEGQDLDLYWDADYAKVLEEWGRDSTWNEIQLLLCTCKGKVLDIACGTGITIKLLEKFPLLELYGFDISDLLISKALEKNIPRNRLKVADATKTNYYENEFDYSYSIGSLEHFTEDGIDDFIRESARYSSIGSFHMIPISRSSEDTGWIKNIQSYFNNSEKWWYPKFKNYYSTVYIIPSKWEDNISYGRWFICIK